MSNLFIKNDYANVSQTDAFNMPEGDLRCYKYSPGQVAVQIRMKAKNGARYGKYVFVGLSKAQAIELANHLLAEAELSCDTDY
jgi:hypothetical protein